MATKFTPLHDRILVRRVEEAATTRGGILIPDSAKDKPQEGAVISVGKGRSNEDGKCSLWRGKRETNILFGKYAGMKSRLTAKIPDMKERSLGCCLASPRKKPFERGGSRQEWSASS